MRNCKVFDDNNNIKKLLQVKVQHFTNFTYCCSIHAVYSQYIQAVLYDLETSFIVSHRCRKFFVFNAASKISKTKCAPYTRIPMPFNCCKTRKKDIVFVFNTFQQVQNSF